MKRNLKIGYLIPQFPGQTHIFFWREIAALEALGIDVPLFSTRLPPPGLISHNWSKDAIERTEYLGKIDPAAILQGLLTLPFSELRKDLAKEGRALVKDLLISAGAARKLVKACKTQAIDHIHAHSCGRAALIAALAYRMGGPSYSVTLHGPLSDYGPGQGFKWRKAAFATVITKKLLGEIEAQIGDDLPARIEIRPMGVDTDVMTRAEPYQPAPADGPIRVFACGRLNIVKGHQDLLAAIRILRDQGLDVRLDIAGEDDDGGNGYHRVLAATVQELGLSDHAQLLGAISAQEVHARLLNAHIFVLASWHEPLGVAYMEAMSCSVPVIGTDAGGVPELITHGKTGVLVSPKSPELLAAAIRNLANDPALATQLGQAGRDLIVREYRAGLGAETIHRMVLETR